MVDRFSTSCYRRAAEDNAAADTKAAEEDGGAGPDGVEDDHFDDPRVFILEAALYHIDTHG